MSRYSDCIAILRAFDVIHSTMRNICSVSNCEDCPISKPNVEGKRDCTRHQYMTAQNDTRTWIVRSLERIQD